MNERQATHALQVLNRIATSRYLWLQFHYGKRHPAS